MPSLGQVVLRFFQTSALVVFVLSGFSWLSPVSASPLPVPSLSVVAGNPQLAQRSIIADHHPRGPVFVHDVDYETPYQPEKRDDSSGATSLEEYRQRFSQHRDTMRNLASPHTQKRDDTLNQADVAAALQAYQLDILGLKALLRPLAADKGLLNYDQNSATETLLKEIINLNKEILDEIDALIAHNLPVLEPLVNDIKCVLIEILDFIENITDGILNAFPALKQLLDPLAEQIRQLLISLGLVKRTI